MQGTNDVRRFVHGAEQAEARGDHVAAEQLLRRALVLQEFSLGAQHPEVANTLNNLAIVCEMNGKFSDAETCYRRAYAIATSSLSPTDPFTETSRENLEQFCQARGIPFNRRPMPSAPSASAPVRPAAAAPPKPPAPAAPKTTAPPPKTAAPPKAAPPPKATPPPPSAPPRHVAPSPKAAPSTTFPDLPLRPPPPAAPQPPAATAHPTMDMSSPPRAAAVRVASGEPSRAIFLALAALVLIAMAGWLWFRSNDAPDRASSAPASSASPSSSSAPSSPAPEPAPSASAPAPAPEEPSPSTKPAEATAPPPAPEPVAPPAPVATAPEAPRPTTRTSAVSVVAAQLCRNLTRSGAWTCAPATGAQSGGTMYYYTRVASPRETTIEHRWYRDDRLQQRVPLRIRANPAGFRTYSQTRVSADRAGSWKVELRSQDGQLLHEEAFAVK